MVFTGGDAETLEDVQRFKELGVRNLMISVTRRDLNATLDEMQDYAENVMSKA